MIIEIDYQLLFSMVNCTMQYLESIIICKCVCVIYIYIYIRIHFLYGN